MEAEIININIENFEIQQIRHFPKEKLIFVDVVLISGSTRLAKTFGGYSYEETPFSELELIVMINQDISINNKS
jgi:hypothetical protein